LRRNKHIILKLLPFDKREFVGVTGKMLLHLSRVVTPFKAWCQTVPNEGNPRLILRLDPLIRTDLEARAMPRGVSLNELAKFVLVEYVKQSAEAKKGNMWPMPVEQNQFGAWRC
jgi:hypothetical protein